MTKIGYARVSTRDQELDIQVDALKKAGCTKIFMEKKSGKSAKNREELRKALEYMREGDKLIAYKIDRLARSVVDLNNIAKELQERNIGLAFLKEEIDFTTPGGVLMFNILAAIAQFERDIINERTSEGRERARSLGKHLGRKGQPQKNIKQAVKLFHDRENNKLSVNDISKMTGVPRSTIYKEVKNK